MPAKKSSPRYVMVAWTKNPRTRGFLKVNARSSRIWVVFSVSDASKFSGSTVNQRAREILNDYPNITSIETMTTRAAMASYRR